MPVSELDADKNPVRGYVLGNEYISQVDGTSFSYYLNDEQGSVRYLTGSDGSIRNHYRYSAFGETITAEETVPNRLRYNGQMADGLTGLYYLRARYYNASLGRFTQEDVIYNDGLNLYAYCNSNPVMYSDPSGFAATQSLNDCNPKNGGEKDSKSRTNSINKPVSDMSDAELKNLGYKRHSDGSIRDSKGHFAGNSGTVPGTPGVDAVENYLKNSGYDIKGREISVKSSDGTLRRYDIVSTRDGICSGVEVKSGSATRTKQQIRIDNELISNHGLETTGQNAIRSKVKRIDNVMVIHVDNGGKIIKIK